MGLVETARSVGAHGKFAGSGGAIVGIYEDDAMFARLVDAFADRPVEVIKPLIEAGDVAPEIVSFEG